jgi:hypothetical protein
MNANGALARCAVLQNLRARGTAALGRSDPLTQTHRNVRNRRVAVTLIPRRAIGSAELSGLHRLEEIVSIPITEELVREQPKTARLVGDMAVAANRLLMRAAEGSFRARRDDALARLLDELRAEGALPDQETKNRPRFGSEP